MSRVVLCSAQRGWQYFDGLALTRKHLETSIVFEISAGLRPSFMWLTTSWLFCTMTNKCTIISQIITRLHVSTLSCHPQGACNQYLAKLHQYFKCGCR